MKAVPQNKIYSSVISTSTNIEGNTSKTLIDAKISRKRDRSLTASKNLNRSKEKYQNQEFQKYLKQIKPNPLVSLKDLQGNISRLKLLSEMQDISTQDKNSNSNKINSSFSRIRLQIKNKDNLKVNCEEIKQFVPQQFSKSEQDHYLKFQNFLNLTEEQKNNYTNAQNKVFTQRKIGEEQKSLNSYLLQQNKQLKEKIHILQKYLKQNQKNIYQEKYRSITSKLLEEQKRFEQQLSHKNQIIKNLKQTTYIMKEHEEKLNQQIQKLKSKNMENKYFYEKFYQKELNEKNEQIFNLKSEIKGLLLKLNVIKQHKQCENAELRKQKQLEIKQMKVKYSKMMLKLKQNKQNNGKSRLRIQKQEKGEKDISFTFSPEKEGDY